MKFADECALILQSIASGPDEGVGLSQIMEDTGLSATQIVDMIENYLDKQVQVKTARVYGVKSNVYARKAVAL